MRILMIAPQPFFRPRGTPLSVLHRIRALLALGHEVELVTYPFGESTRLPGLTIHRIRRLPGVRDVPIGPSVRKAILDAPLYLRARRLAMSGRFDLLHTHEEAGAMGARMSRTCGLPHVYDMHSNLARQLGNFGRFDWPPVVGAFRAVGRYVLSRADGVIVICPELRDDVVEAGYRGPVALLENVLDFPPGERSPGEVEALRGRLDLDGAPTVVYTGNLEPYQGLDLLLESASHVARRAPSVRFVVVGGGEREIDSVRSRARELGVERAFRFVPAVPPERVPLYQRLADALVSPRARGTNTPLKIYQYLRAGRPIVATAIRSHTQALDAESAELVAPEPTALARGLLRVLTDRGRARALVRGARRLAEERYGERAHLDRLAEFLAHVSAGASPGRPGRAARGAAARRPGPREARAAPVTPAGRAGS